MIVILLIMFLCGMLGVGIANSKKNATPIVGFLAGVFLGPFVFLLLLVGPQKKIIYEDGSRWAAEQEAKKNKEG